MLSISHQHGKSMHRGRSPSVVSWAVGFEKVLEDSAGLITFTEFLKREFSAENIKFWIMCEQYRSLADIYQRKKLAIDIVENHICTGASEPVNIDSHSRQRAIDGIDLVQPDLFIPAQKQIFNLMKFDCYQRFLKSELFAECLTAEKLGKPLPFQEVLNCKSPKKPRSRSKSRDRSRHIRTNPVNIIVEQKNFNNNTKNSISPEIEGQNDDLDEKKRKSLLPWQKGRGKSADPERSSSRSPVLRERNTSFRRSKRKNDEKSKGCDGERITSRTTNNYLDTPSNNESFRLPLDERIDGQAEFCRIILPDASATILSTSSKETIGNAIHKLITKYGLLFMAIEATSKTTSKVVELTTPLSSLGGQEVTVELNTLFGLQLPSKNIILVKSRPERTCFEALEPVLKKYGLDLSKVYLHFASTQIPVNLNGPISAANRCQINVVLKGSNKKESALSDITKEKERRRLITSALFEEVIKGEKYSQCDELGILILDNIVNKQNESNGTIDLISPTDDIIRRNSYTINKEKPKPRSVYQHRASIHEGNVIKNPQNEPPKPPEPTVTTTLRNSTGTKNVHYRESRDMTGIWNRAQKRLDDQRGTELNCELPDFLKPLMEMPKRKVSESDL